MPHRVRMTRHPLELSPPHRRTDRCLRLRRWYQAARHCKPTVVRLVPAAEAATAETSPSGMAVQAAGAAEDALSGSVSIGMADCPSCCRCASSAEWRYLGGVSHRVNSAPLARRHRSVRARRRHGLGSCSSAWGRCVCSRRKRIRARPSSSACCGHHDMNVKLFEHDMCRLPLQSLCTRSAGTALWHALPALPAAAAAAWTSGYLRAAGCRLEWTLGAVINEGQRHYYADPQWQGRTAECLRAAPATAAAQTGRT